MLLQEVSNIRIDVLLVCSYLHIHRYNHQDHAKHQECYKEKQISLYILYLIVFLLSHVITFFSWSVYMVSIGCPFSLNFIVLGIITFPLSSNCVTMLLISYNHAHSYKQLADIQGSICLEALLWWIL